MRILAPEVIQTSGMDCGPAALKCLLEGFGIPVSYGRLREACQTDVDGTSIDTLEVIAQQLGLEAEQVMLPLDHVLERESGALPAVVVVRLPSGLTHFVVAWRRHGPWVQLMDPGTGRRFQTNARFLDELYVHTLPVPAALFRDWASSDETRAVIARRMQRLGIADPAAEIDAALRDPSWRSIAAVDAVTRMTAAMVQSGGLRTGAEAARIFSRLLAASKSESNVIPAAYWTARPAPPLEDGEEAVLLRGAVLMPVRGTHTRASEAARSPVLEAAMTEAPSRPGLELWRVFRADGLFTPMVVLAAIAVAALGVAGEAVLFRGLFDVGRYFKLWSQRLVGLSAFVAFLICLLVLEIPIVDACLGLGRRLEARLRIAFLTKIPRLSDRFFSSRPTSDMAESSHSIHGIRTLPQLAHALLQSGMELLVTTIGLAWLYPAGAVWAIAAGVASIAIPLLAQPPLVEADLRVRVHTGGLASFYLDALLGLVAIRTHGAERVLRQEHEALLTEWVRANRYKLRITVLVDGVQAVLGAILAAGLVFGFLAQTGDVGSSLLVVYWALNLPTLGQDLALNLRRYPVLRNLTLRLLEPLRAMEEAQATTLPVSTSEHAGIALELEALSVVAGGHQILDGIDLTIAAGEQVAIVGPSGAGKSSLVGLFLGWHRPSSGRLHVDGKPFDENQLAALRRQTAWVDPTVRLWNRSLIDNVVFGGNEAAPIASMAELADLGDLLQKLPLGWQTELGEGGGLVSGGEGQRVRLARALRRDQARLVILDEPFRGLDRSVRKSMLERVRAFWPRATLLWITHDVTETRDFSRVIVIEGGRVLEDGAPAELLATASKYRAMLEAEESVRQLWTGEAWRHVELVDGAVHAGEEDSR